MGRASLAACFLLLHHTLGHDRPPRVDLAIPAFGYKNHIGIDRGEFTDAIWVYWSKDLNQWDPARKAVVP